MPRSTSAPQAASSDLGELSPVATIKDVAKLAGVDTSTVSRVLRDDPQQAVRPETRERIKDAARMLRYRPNAVGRSLRTRRTDTFAVVVPRLDNPGFIEVIQGIQIEAARQGKLVMLVERIAAAAESTSSPRNQDLLASLVLDGRVDGLIAAFATIDDQLVTGLAERQVPLVLVNRRMPGVRGSVAVDDEAGAALATQQLLDLGHRDIAFVGFEPETDTSRRREAGYRSAMEKAALTVDPRRLAVGGPSKQGGADATETILRRDPGSRPTGIVVSNLLGALGALVSVRAAGLRVPEDVSIVAFNDHDLAEDTNPPLTTVRMPNIEMGRQAMGLIVQAAAGLEVGDMMVTEPAPHVVERHSTAPPRS
ncbi:MAG TPA: LacI family DNA-binding transcriptional regulator [Solirubrobacterales bacterium]|nr:LacI family DNA-binding transcriptional regulator [Solirubrobacterales bacterium]